MENYLRTHHLGDITDLMNESDANVHLSIYVSLQNLQQQNFELFYAIVQRAHVESLKWDHALFELQKKIVESDDAFLDDNYQIKINCHVRFVDLPPPDPRYKQAFPNNDQIGKFVQIKANVVRITQHKLLEKKREYICSKCSGEVLSEAKYERTYIFEPPRSCPSGSCNGNMHQKSIKPKAEYCVDFQEIKVQELNAEKNIPASLIVTLDNDLVDTCQPGECVTLCGTIERRWKQIVYGKQPDIIIAMRCVSLTRDKKRIMISEKYQPEHLVCMQAEWQQNVARLGEASVRDAIIQSICPEVYGMHVVKLAIALVVCSGGIENSTTTSSGCTVRGQSHLLLVGDPGLAKSRLLVSAAAFAPRAVHTTGMGSSAAGLTAAAIQENGEWQLEAGALVLADGGICCIDEFNLMRETDRASIHEAMEQQTVSLAKAGMVCKLSTRCAVLAATNPRNMYAMSEVEGPNAVNIGIASPLMSRFDLVFILRDLRDVEWDDRIASHLLDMAQGLDSAKSKTSPLWSLERLQSHFAAIRSIYPRMTEAAHRILGAYYKACRSDPNRDNARTTIRLLDSLSRLAQAHARLMFRNEVNTYDAVIVIRLMESTHGFGRILRPFDVIKEELPLGPDHADVEAVYEALGLGEYLPDEDTTIDRNAVGANSLEQHVLPAEEQQASQPNSIHSQNVLAPNPVRIPTQSPAIQAAVHLDESDDDLDRILTLDDPFDVPRPLSIPALQQTEPSTPVRSESLQMEQDEDAGGQIDQILSMVLDDAQDIINSQLSQMAPSKHPLEQSERNETNGGDAVPKTSKFKFHQSKMSLNRTECDSIGSKMGNKENIASTNANSSITRDNEPPAEPSTSRIQPQRNEKPSKRNHWLDSDGSSDEGDPNPTKQRNVARMEKPAIEHARKVQPETMKKLHMFVNPKQKQSYFVATGNGERAADVARRPEAETQSKPESRKDEDSAYSTQHLLNDTASVPSGQAIQSQPIFQPSPSTPSDIFNDSDEDLSFLNSLDL